MNRQQRRSAKRGEPSDEIDDEVEDLDDVDDLDEADAADDEVAERAGRRSGLATAVPSRRSTTTTSGVTAPGTRRATPKQFLHEVNVEMRKVVWPTRNETINYASVVLVTLAVLMALIFVLDLAFTKVAGFLFT